MGIYYNNNRYMEYMYRLESELEADVVNNSNMFFGSKAIYINAKRKIEARALGGSIPDGFLFDLSDIENPAFYIVEIELSSHSFNGHIFPQITKFFSFFRNSKSQNELVNKLYAIVSESSEIRAQFDAFLQGRELYKYIKDAVETNQNILIVIDEEMKELPDMMDTYIEWSQSVKVMVLNKYTNGSDCLYKLEPEFENVEYSAMNIEEEEESDIVSIPTESFHLDKVNDNVKEVYHFIKNGVLHAYPDTLFHPTKHYLSIIRNKRRIAHFKFRKKSVNLVVMKNDEIVREDIRLHNVITRTSGVWKFWNGECCEIQLSTTDNLLEIVSLLRDMLEENEVVQV